MNQKGSTIIISSVASGTLLTMLAFSFNVGYIVDTQGELQNAADAAALAAITQLPVTEDEARGYAIDFAHQYVAGQKTVEVLSENVKPGNYDFTTETFAPGVLPINACDVTITRDANVSTGPLDLFFNNFLGLDEVSLQEHALAVVDPRVVGVMANNHLIPYSVLESLVDEDGDGNFDIGNTLDLYLHNGAEMGNFGFLNLNGGSLSNSELIQFITYGFDQDFSIPPSGVVPVDGDTGIRGQSLLDAFESLYNLLDGLEGTIVYLPVHQSWKGAGANSVFEIVDLVAVKIKQVHLIGNIHARFIRAEIVPAYSSAFIVREDAPINNSLQKLRLEE